jgi:hypothetical protein
MDTLTDEEIDSVTIQELKKMTKFSSYVTDSIKNYWNKLKHEKKGKNRNSSYN